MKKGYLGARNGISFCFRLHCLREEKITVWVKLSLLQIKKEESESCLLYTSDAADERSKKVLLIDADPQANASSGLGVDPQQVKSSIYECLVGQSSIKESVVETCVEGLGLVASHIDLVGAELELMNLKNRERVLSHVLSEARGDYDYILIDCSPSLGLITVNALTAADSVIIPVQAEYFALEGISKLLNTIKIIKSKLNPQLEIEGFLLTMYDSRLRLANQIYEELKGHFGNLVFNTVIQRNIRLSEAPSHGLPALLYDCESRGSVNHMELAKELIMKNR